MRIIEILISAGVFVWGWSILLPLVPDNHFMAAVGVALILFGYHFGTGTFRVNAHENTESVKE